MNLQNLVDLGRNTGVDIFAGVTVPAPLDPETVKSAIMVRSGLMTPLYTEPTTFAALTTHWFIAKQWTFEHLIKVIEAEYSPIENYDRYEDSESTKGSGNTRTFSGKITDTLSGEDTFTKAGEEIETHSGTDTETHSGTDTEEHSGTDTAAQSGTTTVAHTGTDTTENTISAENVATYSPDNKSELTHGESVDTTHGLSVDTTHGESIDTTHGEEIETEHGHTVTDSFKDRVDTTGYGKINTREYEKHTITDQADGSDETKSHIHGNIGVTTNQQMIEQELELLRHFDIYGYIAELFEDDNMLLIY